MDWVELFDSPECKVSRKEGGGYYLTACRFESLNPNEVRESFKKLKTMMIAIHKIELDIDYQSLEHKDEDFIGLIDHADNTRHGFTKPAIMYAFGGRASLVRLDKEGNPIPAKPQERWYDYYLSRCDDWIDSTVMFTALEYFAQKTTPFTLGWTYETIKNDEGGFYKLANKWVTETELKLFTESINRYDIDGHGRHVKHPSHDYNRPKMNSFEARTFLAQKLLKPWLIKKRDFYKIAEAHAQAKYLANKLNI
jgi:hypothetical protein